MTEGIKKHRASNGVVTKRYFQQKRQAELQIDVGKAKQELQVQDIKRMLHDSALFPLLLAMAETGREVYLDHELLAKGKPVDDCMVVGQKLRDSTRAKYITTLMDKFLPTAKELAESGDGDSMANYIEQLEKKANHTGGRVGLPDVAGDVESVDAEFTLSGSDDSIDG